MSRFCQKKSVWTLCVVVGLCVADVRAWDVEHDEVAQLTCEFLPKEIRQVLDFNDFAIVMANCHFPDLYEWPSANGTHSPHTVEDLIAHVGKADAEMLVQYGFNIGNWFHKPIGRAALMTMLARAFATGAHAHAAFYISLLTHAVSDESALNHPPLLGFFHYANLAGIDFSMRKIEEGAKNVFGFRSDGHVVHLVRKALTGWKPQAVSGSFSEVLVALGVDIAVRQGAFSGEVEGKIAFAPRDEAERALVALVTEQIKMLETVIWTCWVHRSPTASLSVVEFDRAFAVRAKEAAHTLDPRTQAVYHGVFENENAVASKEGVIGVVCEPYARSGTCLSFVGRIISAACARTMRAQGRAVKGLAYGDLLKGFPDPSVVPTVLMCIGGTGYMSTGPDEDFAKAAREYRRRGGKLIVVGGADVRDITGFAARMTRKANDEVPVSSAWYKTEAGDWRRMALVADARLPRLAGRRVNLCRDPNFNGFCKPVCRMAVPTGETLLTLDNGREQFPVAVRHQNVVWLPEYALLPYLFVKDDPKLPLHALPLDAFGASLLADVLDVMCSS